MTSAASDSPGVVVFPPFLFGGALLVGWIAHLLVPIRPFPPWPARLAGALLLVASAAGVRWSREAMRRAGTNIRPDQPSTTVVVDGPYRHSRNPMYLATTGLFVAVALLIDGLWPLLMVVPLLIVLERGVIRREERYLEGKFGESYRDYRSRVRRWL